VSAPAPLAPAGALVTFLFTDIVGSTHLWERYGEAMHRALARHDAILRAACGDRGGYVFNTVGDAFHVAFAGAADAVAAAIEVQRRILAEPWAETGPLLVRMALHTGQPWQRGGDYFGPALNRCARLVGAAHGGQIVLSRTTADEVQGKLPAGAALKDLGQHRLRDLTQPEHVFQVVHPDLPGEFPRLRSLDAWPNNLPIQLTTFVGRRREQAAVRALTRDHRLVTLTGPGGCGKTRLALQVAADVSKYYHHGAWLVELAAVTDPDRVAQAVATALGIREADRPRPRQDGGPLGRQAWELSLLDHLQSQEILIVLDNCEHLVTACAHLVETLLQACPGVRVLATGREALGVAGEVAWPVPSLSLPASDAVGEIEDLIRYEAIRLFIHRARSVLPGFEVSADNAAAVVQIVRRLDGIPLAIELAAARLRMLSPEQVAARLDDRFRLLTGGSRTALPRHQTLQAAMDWSHDLLDAPERALFRRLSVFGGSFGLEAVEAICGGQDDTPDIVEALSLLIDKSLVHVDERAAAPRYGLLETVRQYGRDKLVAAGEAAVFRRRHRDWTLALAESAARDLHGPGQEGWLDRLAAEHDNLRAALAWSLDADDPVAGLRLAAALWWFWFVRGFLSEGRDWLDRALAEGYDALDAPDAVRAEAALGAGALAWRQRDYDEADRRLAEALDLFRALDDEAGAARSLLYQGRTAHFRGDDERAKVLYDESLRQSDAAGDRWGVAAAMDALGLLAWQQGDFAEANAWLERGLALCKVLGDPLGTADALNILGRVAFDQGDYGRATRLVEESLEAYRALGDTVAITYAYHKLGNIALCQGDLAGATALLEDCRARSGELGEKRALAYAANGLGHIARLQGDRERAAALYTESLALARRIGDKRGTADALANLGWLSVADGDGPAARERLAQALDLYRAMGDKLGLAEALAGLAGALAAGDPVQATRMLAAADALRRRIGAPLSPIYRAEHDRVLARLRAELDAAAFDAAWGEGEAVSSDALTDEARTPPIALATRE